MCTPLHELEKLMKVFERPLVADIHAQCSIGPFGLSLDLCCMISQRLVCDLMPIDDQNPDGMLRLKP